MRPFLHAGFALAIAATMLPANAHAMSVAEFLTRADALQNKGMMAVFSRSEINALGDEIRAAGGAWREAATKATKAGDKSLGCPPPGKTNTTQEEILTGMRSVPAERRATTTVRTTFFDMMKRRFPCP